MTLHSFQRAGIETASPHGDSANTSQSVAKITPPHAVIIVENMTLPADRRVWQEATSLAQDGWRVSVICPKMGKWTKPFEHLNGVDIYRHPLPFEANGIAGYVLEYGPALIFEAWHLLRLGLGKIDVVQICNPPDFLFLPAAMAKFFGAKIIFDHHDLTPELLAEKTGKRSGLLYNFGLWAERQSFALADRVISTNAGFRDIAITRGSKKPEHVDIVYSAPDLENLNPQKPDSSLKKGAKYLALWVGMIGSQDGVDILIEAMDVLRNQDLHLLIVGEGPERKALQELTHSKGLENNISFSGFLSGDDLARAFASADIGVGSDPKNDFNDRLAMNKVMEYMAYGLPIVMFDLTECQNIAGRAAICARDNSAQNLADKIAHLLANPDQRQQMADIGKARIAATYNWAAQKQTYLKVYRDLLKEKRS